MSEREETRVALFESIHHVLAAERLFGRDGLWCDLVPTPRDLSSDCGMALEFRLRDAASARTLLADPRLRTRGVYRRDGDRWEPADDR